MRSKPGGPWPRGSLPSEEVQDLAGHADLRATRPYDRRQKWAIRNLVERIFVEEELRGMGFISADSQTNFSWIALADLDEGEVVESLAKAGVAVRPGTPLGGPGHLRVTYGTRAENERFLEALAALQG